MSCKPGRVAPLNREFRRRRCRGAAAAVVSALCIFSTCDFLDKLNKPFDYTTVTFRCVAMDGTFNRPIKGAAVTIDGAAQEATTDSSGSFSLSGLRTGTHTITITKGAYTTVADTIDLTVHPQPDTFSLVRCNVTPTIDGFFTNPAKLTSVTDSIVFIVNAYDSAGGGIAKMILATGKGDSSIEKNFSSTTYSIKESWKFLYDSAGKYDAVVTVIGRDSDTSQDTIPIVVPYNNRPSFTLIRPSTDGFINGKWGFLEIYVSDPDNNFKYLAINWGDSSKTETSTDSAGVHWHMYNFTVDTTVNISIQLFDSMGARTDTLLHVSVRTLSAPKLDNTIIFIPSPPLTPLDDTVRIGVKVLEINSMYVQEIDWILNPDDPATIQSVRKTYTPQTGAVSSIGTMFTFDFLTAKLKGTNIVQIVVKDRLGTASNVLGSLYIAGKPN